MKTITKNIYPAFPLFAFACLTFLPIAQAVSPPPDGGYPHETTAEGSGALASVFDNAVGNTAIGFSALRSNTVAHDNTAVGRSALRNNVTGHSNTAVGAGALRLSTGAFNVALGDGAGEGLQSGTGNVYIGAEVSEDGPLAEDNTTRIRNVFSSLASGRPVYVNSDNKIGIISSSRRYKEEIKPMDTASETLFALNPVTFRYKKEVDSAQMLSFGLIAEDVAKINPDLITRDEQGKPQTVRYEQVNAMLLNEFLKEHRKVEQMQKQIDALTAGLQKVSAQMEASKPAPQVVNNP